MSNVLDETKQQQVIALGRLGWSLRRIEVRISADSDHPFRAMSITRFGGVSSLNSVAVFL